MSRSEEFLFRAWRRAEMRLDAAIAAWAAAAAAPHVVRTGYGVPTFDEMAELIRRVDRLRERYLAASES